MLLAEEELSRVDGTTELLPQKRDHDTRFDEVDEVVVRCADGPPNAHDQSGAPEARGHYPLITSSPGNGIILPAMLQP